MNLKILKYNITTAAALTAALWGVEQHPTSKAIKDEVVQSISEQKTVQQASRAIASVVEDIKNIDEILIVDDKKQQTLPPEQQKVYEGTKPKGMTHQSGKVNSESLKEGLSKKVSNLAKKIKDAIMGGDDSNLTEKEKEEAKKWGWWGGWFDKDKDKEKKEQERLAKERAQNSNSNKERNPANTEQPDETTPPEGESPVDPNSSTPGGTIPFIPPSVNPGPDNSSNPSNPTTPSVNQAPSLTGKVLTLNEDEVLTQVFEGQDPEGSSLTYSIVENPTQGQLIIKGSSFTYIPNLNYFGSDEFKVKAFDGQKYSSIATYGVQINTINDNPVITISQDVYNINTIQEQIINFSVSDVDSSVDCSSVTVNSLAPFFIPNTDIVVQNGGGGCQLKINLSHNLAGAGQIKIIVQDINGGIDSKDLSFNISNLISLNISSLENTIPQYWQEIVTVTGSLSNNSQLDVSSKVSWLASNANASIVSNNLNALQAGTSILTASLKGVSQVRNLTIKDWSFLSLSKGYVKQGVNAQEKIRAFLNYNDGTFFEITDFSTWSTNNPSLINLDKGKIIIKDYGTGTVTAQFGPQAATAIVESETKYLTNLEIIGDENINLWGTQNYVLRAYYSDNSTQIVTSSALWESSSSSILISNEDGFVGQALAISSGAGYIKASFGSLYKEKYIAVSTTNLISIDVTPKNFIASKNQNISYKAMGTYSDGSVKDITRQVVWSSSLANTLNFLTTGLSKVIYTVTTAVTTNIQASLNSISGQTQLTINPASISSIFITSGNITLPVGQSFNLKSYANLSDGGVTEITHLTQWVVSNNNLEVSNSVENRGQIFGKNNGSALVTASYLGLTNSKTITINNSFIYEDLGIGLTANYFSGINFNTFRGTRIDAQVNFNWGDGNAPLGVGNSFSVRWTGQYRATTTGNIVLCTDSDDGIRVKLDGVLIINNWTNHATQRDCSGNLSVVSGEKYPIEVEFYENSGQAVMILYQGPNSSTLSPVPSTQLFPN